MDKNISETYDNLIMNSADFRAFVEKMEKYSTEEIIIKYELKNNITSYCSDPSKKPT